MLLFIWFLSTAMTCTTKLSGREVAINLIGILFACFVHKQHIFSDVNWRIWHRLILISYLMFGAFIWAASKLTISFHCSLLVRKLPAKAMISVYIFVVVFKSEGWEPGQGDKISEIDSYLFYSYYYYYYTHGYSCLLSAIQGMCPMITLALKTT